MPEDQTGGTPGAEGGSQGAGGTPGAGDGNTPEPIVFETWIKGQAAEVQAAYSSHVLGLRNTVQATRQERDGLSQQLGQLQAALGKNPEEAKRLVEQMTHDLEAANRRATFVEEAVGSLSIPAGATATARTQPSR